MNNSQPISIVLSPAQVDQVVRAAAQGTTPGFSSLIAKKFSLRQTGRDGKDGNPQATNEGGGYFPVNDDVRLSRSLLRGLSILTCFGPDNRERGIIEMAGQLGMSPSTTHRYVSTLVELGLLERSPRTRKYRLALAAAEESTSASKKGADKRAKKTARGSRQKAPRD